VFWHRTQIGPVELGFTGLDLGTSRDDHPTDVRANLSQVVVDLGAERLVRMTQVHGRDAVWADELTDDQVPVADALMTGRPGTAVLVRVADCTPVVLVAPDESLAAVVHSGREGLVAGVVEAAVTALRDRGATEVHAVVGPRACGRCYELPADMADAVASVVPEARSTTSWGTPAIDVGAGVMAQLAALDVQATDIGADECTIEHDRWFSYRRQGAAAGRFGAVAVIRS
jgi:YfiH family protein